MGFNLQNERIQDTYSQLVQISGSTLVDGSGSVIPAITNINSVSSSYAVSASYADYAVSASYEIIKEVSSSHADMADTASYAVYAVTAGTADSATSSSYALTASYAANATIPTLQQVTDEGASTDNDILLTNPNGNQRITIDGATPIILQGAADFVTTFSGSGLYGADAVQATVFTTDPNYSGGVNRSMLYINSALALYGADAGLKLYGNGTSAATSFVDIVPKSVFTTRFGDTTTRFSTPITASSTISASGGFIGDLTGTADTASYIDPTFISASAAAAGFGSGGGSVPAGTVSSSAQVVENLVGQNVVLNTITASVGFSGDASGLTNLPFAGQNKFYEDNTYTFDLPGDANDPAYDIHISQSGVYFISASKVPPYGANGPKVNLYYWPELLEIGETAKVTFFIPNSDTGTGLSYKENVTGSASNEWYWSSTTSPAATATRNISRNLTFSQIATGTGTTTMVKDGGGRAFLVSSTSTINSTNYLYTGDSVNPLT